MSERNQVRRERRGFRKLASAAALATVSVLAAAQSRATMLTEYDASTGLTPDALPNPWTRYGVPMINVGGTLIQDNTFDDPTTESGEYLSPNLPAGTMSLNSGQYGIEVRVRPTSDVPFLGGSNYANCYVFWSDDTYAYNLTIDKDTDDGGPGTTGGIKYGQNSMSDAVTGIDWSVPHTIYVGYRSSPGGGTFDFYVDGVLTSSRVDGSMARTGGFPFARDAVDFGDGTTGQGLDVSAEWYSVRIFDSAVPVVAPSAWNVDASGTWSTVSNWTAGVPDILTGNPGALFGSIITASRTVTLDTNHAIGTMTFDSSTSYTITGPGTLQLTNPGQARIDVSQGSHTISLPLSITSPLVTEIQAGATLSLSGSTIGTWAGLAKEGAGTLIVDELHPAALSVNAGTIVVKPNGLAAGVSRINNFSINPTARLDITNNHVITAMPLGTLGTGNTYTGVTGLIQQGRNGGDWSGSGIVTSQTQATTGNFTSIGVARASDVRPATASATALWAGQTITGTDTLVMYTYGGDATLDGKINVDDYIRIDSGIAAGLSGWSNGDFNYDGKVNIDDYTQFIDANIGTQGPPLFAAGGAGGLSLSGGAAAVPEPASVLGGAVGLIVALGANRSRSRRRT
jgi:hypothetical protein